MDPAGLRKRARFAASASPQSGCPRSSASTPLDEGLAELVAYLALSGRVVLLSSSTKWHCDPFHWPAPDGSRVGATIPQVTFVRGNCRPDPVMSARWLRAPPLAVTHLINGVVYRDARESSWRHLLALQPHVRDYVAVLGLALVLDEAEGYAFLKAGPSPSMTMSALPAPAPPGRASAAILPGQPLAGLAAQEAGGIRCRRQDTRLVLTRDDIVELVRVFLPDSSNEARLIDQIETHINKVIDLGFLRRLKPAGVIGGLYEVRRILKAFVDAHWLAEFDERLAAYRR